MAVNYADKVSAVKAASQKTCWSSHKNSENPRVHWILLPLPLSEEQSEVLKLVLAVKMQRKQPG